MGLCGVLFVLQSLATLVTSQDDVKLQSAAEALGSFLRSTFTSNTSYHTILSTYQSSHITGTLYPDSYWVEGVLEPMRRDTESVMRARYEAVVEFGGKVNEMMATYEVDSARLIEEKLREAEGLHEEADGGHYLLKWYYHPKERIDIFAPVVKIASSGTTHDIFLAEDLLEGTKPDNPDIINDNYFLGTTNGILKFHPARQWPLSQDVYDCSQESWFLDPASSPHEVVFLIDNSLSMQHMTMSITRTAVRRLIKVLPENYRFNVFLFNNETVPLSECLGSEPLPATKLVKDAMVAELSKIKVDCKAHLHEALLYLEEMFFKPSTETSCERMVIILTDGLLEFNREAVKATIARLNTKLIIVESAHPITMSYNVYFTDHDLDSLTCELGGASHHLGNIIDMFDFENIFSALAKPGSVSDVTQLKPWWSDPSTMLFVDMKSMVISYPLYNKTGEGTHDLLAVLGTEVLLRDFTSEYPGTVGSLTYPIITLPNGRVISHPRLLKSPFVPMSFQLQEDHTDQSPVKILYPSPYLTNAPITKVYKILEMMGDNGRTESVVRNVRYQLVVPANDAVDVVIKLRPDYQAYTTPQVNPSTIPCLKNSKCNTKIATDIDLTSVVGSEHENEFMITRHGVLRSTLDTHQDPDPRNVSEFVEFSADPSKIPDDTILLTNTFTDQIVLSKSISNSFENHKTILAVHGLGLSYQEFSDEIDKILSSKQLSSDSEYSVYILDHKGYTVYPGSGRESVFFGRTHGGTFQALVDLGFYTNSTFKDCICKNMTPFQEHTHSSGYRMSWFICDVITRFLALLFTISINILSLARQSLSFLADKRNSAVCCRDIYSYERNFSVTDPWEWNCKTDDKTEHCSNTPPHCETSRLVGVHPIPGTTLLMVTLTHTSSCDCATATQPLRRYADTVVNRDYCQMAWYEKNNYTPLNQADDGSSGICFKLTDQHSCYKDCCRQVTPNS